MRRLFYNIKENFDYKNLNENDLQVFISDYCRSITHFEDYELFRDKTAILRSANLGKKRYEMLELALSKLASEKK